MGSSSHYSDQYCGLIPWYGHLVFYILNFPSHTHSSFCETAGISIRSFYVVYPCVYATWTRVNNVYNLNHSLSLISWFQSIILCPTILFFCTTTMFPLNRPVTMWVSLYQFRINLYVGCNQGQQMYHNSNTLEECRQNIGGFSTTLNLQLDLSPKIPHQ